MNKIVLKNVIYRFFLFLFRTIIPIMLIPYIYRKISVYEMGRVNYILSIGLTFYMFSDLGIYNLGLRKICENRRSKVEIQKVISDIMKLKNTIVLISLILYCLIIFIKYNDPLFYLNTILLFSLFFHVEWVLEGLELYRFITLKTVLVRIITIILIFIFLNTGKGYVSYLVITVFSYLINTLSSYIYLKYKGFSISIFKFQEIKSVNVEFKRLCCIAIMTNSNLLLFNLDKIILGYKNLSNFTAAYSLAEKILTLCTSMTILLLIQVMLPSLIENYNLNKKKYEMEASNLYKILLYLGIPMWIGLFSLRKEIFLLFGGENYLEYIDIFNIFLFYIPTYILFEYFKIVICLVQKLEGQFVQIFLLITIPTFIIKILFFREKYIIYYILLTNLNMFLIPITIFIKKQKKEFNFLFIKIIKIFICSSVVLLNTKIILFENIVLNIIFKMCCSIIMYTCMIFIFDKKEISNLYMVAKKQGESK